MFKDYYQILGIEQDATLEDVRQAYRQMSMKWHPDQYSGADAKERMILVNEAYYILKDSGRRASYDVEYVRYKEFKDRENRRRYSGYSDSEDSFDLNDDKVRKDMDAANNCARDLVEEFFKSFRNTSKDAAAGAWNAAKGWLLVIILLIIVGAFVRGCVKRQYEDLTDGEALADTIGWTRYQMDGFSISVPPTMELRQGTDEYVSFLKGRGYVVNLDDVVFEQRGLADREENALRHYARVIVHHEDCEAGSVALPADTIALTYDDYADLRSMVENELAGFKLIGEPSFEWLDISGVKALHTRYRRTGNDGNTTACNIYLLDNYDEWVKIIVSYREQESEIWLPDLDNVIKTFEWTD